MTERSLIFLSTVHMISRGVFLLRVAVLLLTSPFTSQQPYLDLGSDFKCALQLHLSIERRAWEAVPLEKNFFFNSTTVSTSWKRLLLNSNLCGLLKTRFRLVVYFAKMTPCLKTETVSEWLWWKSNNSSMYNAFTAKREGNSARQTIQMKALDEFILIVLFVLLRKFCIFQHGGFALTRNHVATGTRPVHVTDCIRRQTWNIKTPSLTLPE